MKDNLKSLMQSCLSQNIRCTSREMQLHEDRRRRFVACNHLPNKEQVATTNKINNKGKCEHYDGLRTIKLNYELDEREVSRQADVSNKMG